MSSKDSGGIVGGVGRFVLRWKDWFIVFLNGPGANSDGSKDVDVTGSCWRSTSPTKVEWNRIVGDSFRYVFGKGLGSRYRDRSSAMLRFALPLRLDDKGLTKDRPADVELRSSVRGGGKKRGARLVSPATCCLPERNSQGCRRSSGLASCGIYCRGGGGRISGREDKSLITDCN